MSRLHVLKLTDPFGSTAIKQLLPMFYSQNNIIITITCGVNKFGCKNTSAQCIARYPGQPDMHSSKEGKVLIQGMFIFGILYILHFYPFYTFTEFYLVKLAPQAHISLSFDLQTIPEMYQYKLYQQYYQYMSTGNILDVSVILPVYVHW